MSLFTDLRFYVFTAVASAVSVWASHNPVWHDPAMWFLGVIGHAIGVSHAQANGNGNGSSVSPNGK